MTRNKRLIVTFAAVFAVVAAATIFVRHAGTASFTAPQRLDAATPLPSVKTLLTAIQDAGLSIDALDVRTAEGIVIVRGRTSDATTRDQATNVLRQIGVNRVANMIRIDPRRSDDEIARAAERRLVSDPGLGGCHFAVSCERGVLHVRGSIISDLQRETTARVLRKIDGVVEVKTDLQRVDPQS